MKTINYFFVFALSVLMFFSCNQQEKGNTAQLEESIMTLQNQVNNSYKPGFGEFMSSIQVHHAKLWFAGTNENWKLAEFEVHEIQEALENIQKFNADRSEAQSIPMINPAMDSISKAIKQKSQLLFKSSFNLLTNSCNNCHKATQHEFNVITIPVNPPISNQNFKPQ